MTHSQKFKNHILEDIGLVVLSVLVAIILVRTDILITLLATSAQMERLGSFIAGMFFTSVFTTAPAIATLSEIAQANSLFRTAFFGALGAVTGDLIIFRFVRDRFSEDITELIGHKRGRHRFNALFKLRFFRWLTFLAGGLIIASPLPDELGIGLLGFSKMKTLLFIPLSFTFNFIGIIIIGIIARAM